MRDLDFERILAALGVLLSLGISAELALVLLLGYLWGHFGRGRGK